MKNYLIIVLLISFISCKKDKKNETPSLKEEPKEITFDESKYVLDSTFAIGDARRYGLTAENAKSSHPTSGKNRMTTVIDLAEESGMEINFPSGYYGMNLTLDNRKNLKLRFNNSEFSNVSISQGAKENSIPENITLKGTLNLYGRLGLTEAKNISIDSVILKTDTAKNLYKMRNTGCHIYHGCDNIKINYLEVQDLGSGSEKYKYTHAALAIDGWNNNPQNVTINKLYIKSTDRHGIYLTGSDHIIKEVVIDKFGVGSAKEMDGMQDADNKKGEHKEFTALWLNKCYDCYIEKITINEKDSKGKYTAFFDYGDESRPSEIDQMIILNDNPSIKIKKDSNARVVVNEMSNN